MAAKGGDFLQSSDIHLTHRERKILSRAQWEQVPIERAPRLLRLKLTQDVTTHIPGHMPQPTGRMTISDAGRDYLIRYRQTRRDLWLKNIWIPILVTIVTNLAIRGIEWLLPRIQQWLSNTPG